MNRTAIVASVISSLATAGVCWVAFSLTAAGGQGSADGSPSGSAGSSARTAVHGARSGAATVDGTSAETFRASLEAVQRALPREQQDAFERALALHAQAVLLPTVEGNDGASASGRSREELERAALMSLLADRDGPARRLRARLNGWTAEKIMAAGAEAEAGAGARAAPLPRLGRTTVQANEAAAIATLKNICSAQAQLQSCGTIDADGNGTGEYGFFGEMAGATPPRKDESGGVGGAPMDPPVLSPKFAQVQGSCVTRFGYLFQVYLPDRTGAPAAEASTGGSAGVSIAAAKAEVLWSCYAWPTERGSSGDRAFFVNQAGDVLACANTAAKYGGSEHPPRPLAAFVPGEQDMSGKVAANAKGTDGEQWVGAR